jgi:hypothetical protein
VEGMAPSSMTLNIRNSARASSFAALIAVATVPCSRWISKVCSVH